MLRKVFQISIAVALLLAGVLFSGQVTPVAAREFKLLEFNTMVGVPQGLTGTQSPIRGINGGGLPWKLTSAKGELASSGKLELSVRGLVFGAGPNEGKNTVANFRAVVSCLTDTGAVVNVTSDLFPATVGAATEGGGNAKIETTLALPQPCIAPIIFVTSPTGSWFAVTGHLLNIDPRFTRHTLVLLTGVCPFSPPSLSLRAILCEAIPGLACHYERFPAISSL